MNTNDFGVEKCELKADMVTIEKGKEVIHWRLNRKPDTIYLSALNIENAKKKFLEITVQRLARIADSDPEFRQRLVEMDKLRKDQETGVK